MRKSKLNYLFPVVTAALLAVSGVTRAGVMIDFKALADGALGESAWTILMFKADGTHTTNNADAFLKITGTNGSKSYAYMDSNKAGLGVCGALTSAAIDSDNYDKANPNTGSNLCNPSSDDNISYHNGNPEMLHFDFLDAVTVDKIWVNNNHDGDKSLLNDSILVGLDGMVGAKTLMDGGYKMDSSLALALAVAADDSFHVGFDPNQACGGTMYQPSYNNCELYVSKIEFTRREPGPDPGSEVPAPGTLALLGFGIAAIGWRRRPASAQ